MTAQDEFVDYVETSVIESESGAVGKAIKAKPVDHPASVFEEAANGETMSGEVEAQAAQVEEIRKGNELQKIQTKLRNIARLQEIKADPEILASAGDFLKDMAGVEPMQRTYNSMGFIAMRFKVMDSRTSEEITQQTVRDSLQQRVRYMAEVPYLQYYRLAGSLMELTITDPQSKGKIIKKYELAASVQDVAAFITDEIIDTDLPIRRKAIYLTRHMLASSTIYSAVLGSLNSFEKLLSDLAFLATEDPDFFQNCLTEGI
jgi:hypothetical protein